MREGAYVVLIFRITSLVISLQLQTTEHDFRPLLPTNAAADRQHVLRRAREGHRGGSKAASMSLNQGYPHTTSEMENAKNISRKRKQNGDQPQNENQNSKRRRSESSSTWDVIVVVVVVVVTSTLFKGHVPLVTKSEAPMEHRRRYWGNQERVKPSSAAPRRVHTSTIYKRTNTLAGKIKTVREGISPPPPDCAEGLPAEFAPARQRKNFAPAT